MELKGKPVYDFQNVEFTMNVETKEDLNEFFSKFETILARLKELGDKYPQPSKNGQKQAGNNAKKEPKASPNQIRWLINLGVDKEEAKQMTTTEASELIKELNELGNNG